MGRPTLHTLVYPRVCLSIERLDILNNLSNNNLTSIQRMARRGT